MGILKDLTGNRYGRLTVLNRNEKNDKQNKPLWICRCDCGNVVVVRGTSLKCGDVKSCGCLLKEIVSSNGIKNSKNLIGKKFGRLTVNNRVGSDKNRNALWKCSCDCGNEIEARTSDLLKGSTLSCGCLRKEIAINNSKSRVIYNNYTIEKDFVKFKAHNSNHDVLVDLDDYEKVKKYSWYESKHGYIYTRIDKKWIFLSRLIMNVENINDRQITIDHINHNTYDNRKKNLRVANQSEQNMNQGIQGNNTSGVTGVSWKEKIGKWQAQIGYRGKVIYIGVFDKLEEATKARREAEIKYFGEFNYKDSTRS